MRSGPSPIAHGGARIRRPAGGGDGVGRCRRKPGMTRAPDADVPVDPEMLAWADLIFVMEAAHKAKLQRRFGPHLKRARVIVLGIPDDYAFMQPELMALLEKKVGPHLR